MAINHLTTENFNSAIASGTVLVDFWATWCGPCRMQAPILEELDARMGGKVSICKVDVDEEPSVAGRFGVSSIPTLIAFKDGQVVNKRVGVTGVDQLEDMLK
jgi:thioredoxin 1